MSFLYHSETIAVNVVTFFQSQITYITSQRKLPFYWLRTFFFLLSCTLSITFFFLYHTFTPLATGIAFGHSWKCAPKIVETHSTVLAWKSWCTTNFRGDHCRTGRHLAPCSGSMNHWKYCICGTTVTLVWEPGHYARKACSDLSIVSSMQWREAIVVPGQRCRKNQSIREG